jgi:ADP-ribosyltransferase exoenzyme
VRNARGDAAKVDAAARQLAKALALLLQLVVEALIGFAVQQGVPAALEKLRGSKLLEVVQLKNARAWLQRRAKAFNLLRLANGDRAGLRKALAFYKDAQEVERLLKSGRTLAELNALVDSSTRFQAFLGKRYAQLMAEASALLADPNLQKTLAGLTQEEIAAIIGYTGMDYSTLNSALRSNDPKRVAKLSHYIDRASGGLAHLPNYVGLVYRGASPPPHVVALYVVGNVVEEAGFTSTSYVKSAAFQGKVQYTILSKTGKKIDFLSNFKFEVEVLFAPGARFKVLEVTQSAGTTYVKMNEL